MNKLLFLLSPIVIGSMMSTSFASGLRFGFTNPSFNGNGFNSAHFLALAESQQQHHESEPQLTAVEEFRNSLETQLLSSTIGEVIQGINDNSIDPGGSDFNAGNLDINVIPTGPDSYRITITDGVQSSFIDFGG